MNSAPEPDGGPFDPAATFTDLAQQYEPFSGEPVDLSAHWADFDWPLVVLSGERDLRTPPPIAARIADAVPDGALVPLPGTGHSALDTHGLAALAAIAAVRDGSHRELAADPAVVAGLRRTGASRHLGAVIRAGLRAEGLLPGSARRVP